MPASRHLTLIACGLMTVCLPGALTQTQAALLYDNTTTSVAGFNSGLVEVGDEIVLAGGIVEASVTRFVLEYWATAAGTAQVRFYKNDGTEYSTGRNRPSTVIWDSLTFPIDATEGNALIFDSDFGTGITVPGKMTWTIQFSGLAGGGQAGPSVYDPPTTGSSADDYWLRAGGAWSLAVSEFTPMNFGAKVEGTVTVVPEPASAGYLAVLVIGLASAARTWRRRAQGGRG